MDNFLFFYYYIDIEKVFKKEKNKMKKITIEYFVGENNNKRKAIFIFDRKTQKTTIIKK